ncbi:MAG TPA: ribosomal-processing cysteine protease Prp [Firmicutes bacterium]|nr:ribosomal-processing cysteine protease Prp [Bacillota bacterium]
MIHAAFFVRNGSQTGFSVSGHSGLADPGADILCAAVSAMTMLVVNTLQGGFSNGSCEVRSGDNSVTFRTERTDVLSEALLKSFRDELTALQAEYPENLRVCVSNELERTK